MVIENKDGVIVNGAYLREHLELTREQIVKGILYSDWTLPVLETSRYLVGMGLTGHKGMPTAFMPSGSNKKLDVFAKPFNERGLALKEFQDTTIAHQRGINICPVIALADVDNGRAILINELAHSAEPLSARDLSFRLNDPRVYNPYDMLVDLIHSVASMHDRGVAHGDLHLGNIGHQFQKETAPKIVFFDFETANVLSDDDLRNKQRGYWLDENQRSRFQSFEKNTIEDLAVLLAYLRYYGFPIPRRILFERATGLYFTYRTKTPFLIPEQRFRRDLLEGYNRTYKAIKSSRE